MKHFLFMISLMMVFSACQKKTKYFLTIKGRVVDAYQGQAIPNYPVRIDYTHASHSMGLNLSSWGNISHVSTDQNGYFTLTTPYEMAKDADDTYSIIGTPDQNYFGFAKTLNAFEAEAQKNIDLGDIQVDKMVKLHVKIQHTGAANSADLIFGNIHNLSFSEEGNNALITIHRDVPFHKTVYLNWSYNKGGLHAGPFMDSLICTNPDTDYTISY